MVNSVDGLKLGGFLTPPNVITTGPFGISELALNSIMFGKNLEVTMLLGVLEKPSKPYPSIVISGGRLMVIIPPLGTYSFMVKEIVYFVFGLYT